MISLIRDYLDVLSNIVNTSHNYFDVIKITFKFGFDWLINVVGYLVTFGWLKDIMYLPIEIRKWEESLITGKFFYENVNIIWNENLCNNKGIMGVFFLGFVNSVFCSFALSTSHLIALRRLYVQGLIAGIASTLGIIVGECLFLFCPIFGIRSPLTNWLSLHPLTYFLGIALVLLVVYEMCNEKRIRPIELSEKKNLKNIFVIQVLLSWTEESNFGQYLSNVTLTNEPSLLRFGTTNTFENMSYFLGLVLGNIFFSAVFIGLSLLLKRTLFEMFKIPYSVLLKRINKTLLIIITGLCLSTFPYYGFDYLLTSPLGLISEDKILNDSILSQKNIKDQSRILTSLDVVVPFFIDTDVSYFDRGEYGLQPGFFRRNFEELNYQGEYAWLIRRDKKPNLYSSNPTTETTLRDLFIFNEKPGSVKELSIAAKKKPVEKPNPEFSGSLDEFNNVWVKTDRDGVKLEKRYAENYNESRVSDGFVIGDTFNNFPQMETVLTPIEISLKEKFYENPIYKTLLNLEIDSFLNREKKENRELDNIDENELYKKRVILSQYYDTIRDYQGLPYKNEFNDIFQGSKTFVDRAYNHQFKGTLSVIRRLFAVTLDNSENPIQAPVLKYDKPLWQKDFVNFGHEELKKPKNVTSIKLKLDPFLEETDSTPFYLGWDNDTRQMILTKRFTPNTNKILISEKESELTSSNWKSSLKNIDSNLTKEITFTTWPLQKDLLLALKAKPTNHVVTLFEPTTNPDVKAIFKLINTRSVESSIEVYNFPSNMRYANRPFENLVPNQGGFFWPGSEYKAYNQNQP